jgi:hypothetical protein
VELASLTQSAPLFDFCSNGTQIQYLNPLNSQKQIFTVPYTPVNIWQEWPAVSPAVPHVVVPPVISSPPVVVPPVIDPPLVVVPPVLVDPPVVPVDCHHTPPPPPVATPEPGTYALAFAGGSFLIILGARKRA